jgi:hypothetical protein
MTSYPIILQVRNINGIWNFFVRSKAAFCPFSFDTQKTVTFDEQNKKSEHLKMLARGPIHFWENIFDSSSPKLICLLRDRINSLSIDVAFLFFFSRFWSRIATQPKKDQLAHQSLSRRSWDPLLDYFENTRGFIRRVSVTLAWPVEGYSWITVRGTYTELFRCTYATGLILSSAYRDLYSLTFLWKLAN